jgi:hypothetical protein
MGLPFFAQTITLCLICIIVFSLIGIQLGNVHEHSQNT